MNIDHQKTSFARVVRLGVITAVFAIACGLPDSMTIVMRAARALVTG